MDMNETLNGCEEGGRDIRFCNVKKVFKSKLTSKTVHNDVNMTIKGRGIVALVGRNGSGKTTLFNMIMGYSKVTNGKIYIGNKHIERMEDALLYATLIDEKVRYFEEEKTLEEIVKNCSRFNWNFDIDRCFEIMERFELDRKKRFNKLSKGMKNEFNIAIGFASRKDITLLDEPCSGLDEIARETFNDILNEEFSITGKLYIVSTHMLAEIENIVSSVIFLDGKGDYITGDSEEIKLTYIRVSGDNGVISELIGERWHTDEKHIGAYSSSIIKNDLSFSDRTYIRKNDVAMEYLKLHEIGKIICKEEG